jgi:hypothetical protein
MYEECGEGIYIDVSGGCCDIGSFAEGLEDTRYVFTSYSLHCKGCRLSGERKVPTTAEGGCCLLSMSRAVSI